jgi:hypothetical protein
MIIRNNEIRNNAPVSKHQLVLKGGGDCTQLHCKENPIFVLQEKKERGLSPIFHIHVSVSYLYISHYWSPYFPIRIDRPIMGIY